MADGPDIWPKPHYEVGQPKHVHALGVVAAQYNGLESSLLALLYDYTGLSAETTQWLFSHTSNNVRLELLKRCVNERESDPYMKNYVLHFADWFDVCSANRNVLMHSIVSVTDEATLNFTKSSRNDPRKINAVDLSIEDIRRVADDITVAEGMGLRLHTRFISTKSGKPDNLAEDVWRFLSTLPKKPRVPSKLLKPKSQAPNSG